MIEENNTQKNKIRTTDSFPRRQKDHLCFLFAHREEEEEEDKKKKTKSTNTRGLHDMHPVVVPCSWGPQKCKKKKKNNDGEEETKKEIIKKEQEKKRFHGVKCLKKQLKKALNFEVGKLKRRVTMHDEKNNNNSSSKNTKTLSSSEKKATEKQLQAAKTLSVEDLEFVAKKLANDCFREAKGEDEVEKGGGGKGEGGILPPPASSRLSSSKEGGKKLQRAKEDGGHIAPTRERRDGEFESEDPVGETRATQIEEARRRSEERLEKKKKKRRRRRRRAEEKKKKKNGNGNSNNTNRRFGVVKIRIRGSGRMTRKNFLRAAARKRR